MQSSVLHVIRDGDHWAIAADGERLALARSKRAAEHLAREAVEILRASGAEARVELGAEQRSFKPKS